MNLAKVKVGDGVHYILPCLINEKNANFLVDTGASRTIIDADQINTYTKGGEIIEMCKPIQGIEGTTSQVNEITLDKFQVGNLLFENYRFLSSSMKSINAQYRTFGLKRIQGILGSDLLSEGKAKIDLLKEKIYFQ